MDRETRLKRLRFRSWHRGTKEADLLIGGFFDARSADWNDAEITLFEELLEEQDVDIMAWALGTAEPDPAFAGPLMDLMMQLDFISLPEGLSTHKS